MSIEAEVGYMKGTVDAMDTRLTKVEAKVDAIDSKVDTILNNMSEAKGGWKAVSLVASTSVIAGGAAAKLLHFLGMLGR